MTTQYTLFDIPTNSTPPRSWSPNVWNARGVLNYKKVTYETEWVEYPDIRVRLAELGIPSKGGLMPYTLPMMRVTITPTDGSEPQIKYLTDSADIAKYLNDNHPEPPIDFDSPITGEAVKVFNENLMDAFVGLVLCDVDLSLPERSAAYFHETRPKWMMMPIKEFKQKKLNEGAWEKMEKGMKVLADFIGKNGGPFVQGEKVSYGDIRLLGYLMWAREAGPRDVWEKIEGWGGEVLQRFMKAFEENGALSRITY
ncbi:hypothetical protein TWF281_000990 [Arthrobotrys megalospora]